MVRKHLKKQTSLQTNLSYLIWRLTTKVLSFIVPRAKTGLLSKCLIILWRIIWKTKSHSPPSHQPTKYGPGQLLNITSLATFSKLKFEKIRLHLSWLSLLWKPGFSELFSKSLIKYRKSIFQDKSPKCKLSIKFAKNTFSKFTKWASL